MKYALILLMLLLGGCNTVMSPQEMTATGERSMHAARRPPEQAALCIARNVESGHQLVATTRPAEKPGAYEVLLRTGATNMLAYALAEPGDTGSRVSIWLDPMPFHRKSEIVANMLKGC
jgi:hypothetical protein